MKTRITLVLLTVLLVSSCQKTGDNQNMPEKDSVSVSDSRNTGVSKNHKILLTSEELQTDRRQHPEKYLVAEVVLNVIDEPHRYDVVLINNSPYKLKRGVVLVDYDVYVGNSRLNTIHDEVEFLNVKSGDTSTVVGKSERSFRSRFTWKSHSIISTDFQITRK